MDKEKIKYLIEKFNQGQLTEDEITELEHLIEYGSLDLKELSSLQDLRDRLNSIRVPEPGRAMDQGFYSFLTKEKSKQTGSIWDKLIPEWNFRHSGAAVFRVAYSFFLILCGAGLGLIITMNSGQKRLDRLSEELEKTQNMMTLILLEKSSASDRLKAIQLTGNIREADEKVIDALLKTLNHDENANVRLAAIDALIKYAGNERVRMGMINSITRQELPIVQVALADAMVLIQEKRSVQYLKELIDKENTDRSVKRKLQISIDQLI
jgi:hypothetical protein